MKPHSNEKINSVIFSKYGQYASSVGMGAKENVVLQNCMESLQISKSNNIDQHGDCV
jgi:hypothetical protein